MLGFDFNLRFYSVVLGSTWFPMRMHFEGKKETWHETGSDIQLEAFPKSCTWFHGPASILLSVIKLNKNKYSRIKSVVRE